jgi:hypothetical protein
MGWHEKSESGEIWLECYVRTQEVSLQTCSSHLQNLSAKMTGAKQWVPPLLKCVKSTCGMLNGQYLFGKRHLFMCTRKLFYCVLAVFIYYSWVLRFLIYRIILVINLVEVGRLGKIHSLREGRLTSEETWDRRCTYNVTSRRVRASIVAVGK